MLLKPVGTLEVAICTENVVIPTLGVRILFKGERLEYPPDYVLQHLSVPLPLLIHPVLRNITVWDWYQHESHHYDGVC
jgi:hypothetical protein